MQKTEITLEVVKIAPAAPVTVMSFLGYSVADWASTVTLIYVLMLLSYFVWKKLARPWQRWRRKRPFLKGRSDGISS
jgi:hypothetical protein